MLRYLLLLVCLCGCTSGGELVDQGRVPCVVIRQSGTMIMDVWITAEVPGDEIPLSEINRRPPVCNEFSAISSAWMTNTP